MQHLIQQQWFVWWYLWFKWYSHIPCWDHSHYSLFFFHLFLLSPTLFSPAYVWLFMYMYIKVIIWKVYIWFVLFLLFEPDQCNSIVCFKSEWSSRCGTGLTGSRCWCKYSNIPCKLQCTCMWCETTSRHEVICVVLRRWRGINMNPINVIQSHYRNCIKCNATKYHVKRLNSSFWKICYSLQVIGEITHSTRLSPS